MLSHVLGFPRIGPNRELKKAVEKFWKGNISSDELLQTAKELRSMAWKYQTESGLSMVSVGDFSLYDHVLDTTAMLGAVPERFAFSKDEVDLDTYFNMARGNTSEPDMTAMEMTKWFDTNYHYIVPEFQAGMKFSLSSSKLVGELTEALSEGHKTKAVLLGPVSYVYLGKAKDANFDKWDLLDSIVEVYVKLLKKISDKTKFIQIDEPILGLDLDDKVKAVFEKTYQSLSEAAKPAKTILATYFSPLYENLDVAVKLPVDFLHLDCLRGREDLGAALAKIPPSMGLSLGVINGRNIWKTNLTDVADTVRGAITDLGEDRVMVGSSCSLLHVPVDLDNETKIDLEIKKWLAFARQKCEEVALTARAANNEGVCDKLAENSEALEGRSTSSLVKDSDVAKRMQTITSDFSSRKFPFPERQKIQKEKFGLPLLPTTTIGSYPQTKEVRLVRRQFKTGEISEADYKAAMRNYIKDVIVKQENLGLDVLVHGEPERNDMVEYFGEQLKGFCFTENGWVQSYGSRCVKPPVIYGDVSRPDPMTVEWLTYAQSLSQKPVKGMLTGPVTILCWSFVRDDQPRSVTCRQIALAVRDEVRDLEGSGLRMIQIDEAALREGLPLRQRDWNEYLSWAVECFKIATCGVKDETQIHTHMCYSEFNNIAKWIAKMDADVISIEASRSGMELLDAFGSFEYPNEIGPGVYDIHSPRVPSEEEMTELLLSALKVIPKERLWVNPDCGLKTRDWPETMESLKNMVAAAKEVRAEL